VRTAVLSMFLGVVAVHMTPASAQGQEPVAARFSFDPVTVDSSSAPGATCYMSARYIVVEHRRRDRLDADFYVRPREGNRCEADSLPGDYVLRDEWAAYFSALHGDVLFIDSGTGPDIRYLILVDLTARQKLAELSYVELVPGPDSTTVGLWDGYELEESLPGCAAPPGGLISGVDSLVFLDVRSGHTRFSGRTRCAHRQ
jgi:hypothetical protein